ncbi:hypothetical protein AK88_05191 [Plasmodium fragile]|uniref:DNA-3-methyladenine glycosylase II n=1 Tax=Plasmodium fragile TaxID=5857 RepID=A0A0D9QDU7_PLAFR|nr:uncharacterized protein AK88_05191 [Plasmodium fragile]KJP85173.1 hypothetical protein AK88_05191 [Plasmodium fragile]
MQNEKKRRKGRGSLAATASPAVMKMDSKRGALTGEENQAAGRKTPPPKSKKHKGEERVDEVDAADEVHEVKEEKGEKKKKKNTNELECMAYVYLLMEYFFEHNAMTFFTENFYLQGNVLSITEALIGHILWVYDEEKKKLYGSRITELEAYNGIEDKASHAYNNKKTNRNATMFAKGGVSYVYLCYGIHNCLNIVTNEENIPDAILVRSLEPCYGMDTILLNKFKMNSAESPILATRSQDPSACAMKGEEGSDISTDGPDESTQQQSKYFMAKEKLQRVEAVKAILKLVNMKKLTKACSGPGCVTKCLGITRQDDKARFCSDLPHCSRQGKKRTSGGVAPVQGADAAQVGVHATSQGKKINPDHISTCNISHLQQSRFFISVCPTTNQIINFYEALVAQKGGNHKFIGDVYSQYKMHLLEYFNCMKWDQENMVVQRDKRVGVAYAEEAALYDYRFLLKGHPSISVLPK